MGNGFSDPLRIVIQVGMPFPSGSWWPLLLMAFGKYSKKRSIFSFKKSFFPLVGQKLRESFSSSAKRAEKLSKLNTKMRMIGNFRICLLFSLSCCLYSNTKNKNCPFLEGLLYSLSGPLFAFIHSLSGAYCSFSSHCSGWMMLQPSLLLYDQNTPCSQRDLFGTSSHQKDKYLSLLCQ